MKNFFSITFSVLVLSYSRAFAAEEGMPQLNPEFWVAQIFWLVLIFSTLYIAISKIFLPKIINVLKTENSKLLVILMKLKNLKIMQKIN